MSVKVSAVLVLVEHTFQKENLQVDDVVEPLLESTEKVLVQFPFSLNLEKKKSFVLFCPIFHRISKVQNLFRLQKLWPSSAKAWVSCPAWPEESPVGK